VAPYGNFNSREARGTLSGPIVADKLSRRVCRPANFRTRRLHEERRHRPRSRPAIGGVRPRSNPVEAERAMEARAMFSGERARDGDYALNDLGSLRARPFHAARDVEGFTHRDIFSRTIQPRNVGRALEFSTTTGFLNWKTEDFTDLDYHAAAAAHAEQRREGFQFTEEARVASRKRRRSRSAIA